jgi:hypothetical protein
MSFYQTIRSGLLALFNVSTADDPPTAEPTITIEEIRAEMLEMVGQPTDATAALVRRIRYATDPQALWFMRSELMGLLARRDGEAVARVQLEMLSQMFRELLPSGLRSRPSPLLSHREERDRDRGDSVPR